MTLTAELIRAIVATEPTELTADMAETHPHVRGRRNAAQNVGGMGTASERVLG
jgi:hypothetical protein